MNNVFYRIEYLKKLNREAKDRNEHYFEEHVRNKLTERDVLQFEEYHNVELPEEYKKYLLEFGNGIDGNMLHIFPIEYYNWLYQDEALIKNYLSTDFPFSEKNEYVSFGDDYMKETTGTITLTDWGCGIHDLLVISGEEKGSVWTDDRSSDNGIYKTSSSFRKYLEDRIDVKMKALVDQEKYIYTLFRYPPLVRIIEVNGRGRGRDVLIMFKNKHYYVYHYQADEFLEEGEQSKVLLPDTSERMVFIIDQAQNFEEVDLNETYRFEYEDELKRSVQHNSSLVKVRTRILESYQDGFSPQYYTRCRVDNFPDDLYIVTYRDISHLEGKECMFEGKLGSLIKGINI